MYKQLWKDFHAAVCSINFYSESGIKLISLTGFYINNCIVTDELIYKIVKYDRVVFQFVNEDGFTPGKTIHLTNSEFSNRINRIVEFDDAGYAIIDFEDLEISNIPSLIIETNPSYEIGESIGVIGYHISQDNISLHKGILSSFFKSPEGKRLIQFDTDLKLGNSGSPLINLETGKIIGVVGYRLSAFTKSYESFKQIIDENLKLLKNSEGKMNILDIDPIQVLIANQHQLKQINREFFRSANMSFGYAHELYSISRYFDEMNSCCKNEVTFKKAII